MTDSLSPSVPPEKYGFFCDIEEDTEITYYVVRKSNSYEIKRTLNQNLPAYADRHPSYSPSQSTNNWCIDIKDTDNNTDDDDIPKSKSWMFRIKHRLKKYLYSSIICSIFMFSIYISFFEELRSYEYQINIPLASLAG
jgi:hypothetical protein